MGSPPVTGKTESWDGTSWTEVNDLNTARYGGGGAGNNTQALAFAGITPPNSALTEFWNGSSWTEVNDLSTARQSSQDSGNAATSVISAGGYTSTQIATSEEFTASSAVSTVTTS